MANAINAAVTTTIQLQDTSLPNVGTVNPLFNRSLNLAFNGNDFAVQRVTATANYVIPQSGAGFDGLVYVRNLSASQTISLLLSSSVSNQISVPLVPGSYILYFSPAQAAFVWPFSLQVQAFAGSNFPIDFEYALAAFTNP